MQNNYSNSLRQLPLKLSNTVVYINISQYDYIKKRKIRREYLDTLMVKKCNDNYEHESRHKHAMKRLRAPSGRFMTKWEAIEFRRRTERKQ